MPDKIESMYAFVATEDDGTEGVMGANVGGQWFPFVGADLSRVKSLYPIAKNVSKTIGKPFKILHFTSKKDITEEVRRGYEKTG